MTRSKRMGPVQRVAENRERTAGRRTVESSQALAAQESRLQELRTYREQYSHQFENSGGEGLDAVRMRDYRVFLARLTQAIRQQELLIEQMRSRHEQTRKEWVATRTHSQAVDKLIARFREHEDLQERRLEQRTTDERSNRDRGTGDKG